MEPFISRTDLGNYLKRDLSADEGATIVVDAACAVCRTTADEQQFNYQEDEEIVLDGTGSDWLALPQLPVVDVSAVEIDGEALATDEFVFSDRGGLIRLEGCWPRGRANIAVTYSHGYAIEEGGDGPELPADVRFVALALAARLYEQGPIGFETIGSRQVRYGQAIAGELTQTERAILARYRP